MKELTKETIFIHYLQYLEHNSEEFIKDAFNDMKKENAPQSKDAFKKYLNKQFEKINLYDVEKEISLEFKTKEIKKLINRITNKVEKQIIQNILYLHNGNNNF